MATLGLNMLYTGIKADDGSTVIDADKGLAAAGVYPIDTSKANGNLGTKTASITGLSGTISKITGNNEVTDISNPPSAPSVAIDSNEINFIVKQKLLGRVSDGKGGYSDTDKPVEAGLIIESRSPIFRTAIYYCFGRGIFNEAGQNIQSNTDTAETRDDDNLTFTALNYDGFGGQPYKVYAELDPKFDKQAMFDAVFPGQTFYKNASNGTSGK